MAIIPEKRSATMDERACTKCQVVKPMSEFGRKDRLRGKRHAVCKECTAHEQTHNSSGQYTIKAWRKGYVMQIAKLDEIQTKVQENSGLDDETGSRLLFLGFWGYVSLLTIFQSGYLFLFATKGGILLLPSNRSGLLC